MPELTRRRSADHRHKCWQIYYGDVHIGTIAERGGNPHDTGQWEWNCGFYPGSHPGEHQSATAATLLSLTDASPVGALAEHRPAWSRFGDPHDHRSGWHH